MSKDVVVIFLLFTVYDCKVCNQFSELEANQRDTHNARQTSRKQSHDWFKFYIGNLTNYT